MLSNIYNIIFINRSIFTYLAVAIISFLPDVSSASGVWIKIGCGYIQHFYNETCNPTQENLDISCDDGFRLECQEIYSCSPPDNPFKTSCRCVTDVSCAITVNGSCGSANNVPTAIAPAVDLCSSGTPTPLLGSGPWTWQCMGEGGGLTVSCSASIPPPPPPPPSFGGACPT